MVKEFVKGKKYDTGDGIGVFVEYDDVGDPMFKMIGEHMWALNIDGYMEAYKRQAMKKFKELPDETI